MKKILIYLVRGYQRFISPAFPPSCRYYPTCSNYMIKAIQTHGALKGTVMGTARILRCHPFVKGGIDYVPLTFRLTRNKKDKKEPDYKKVVKIRVALSDKETIWKIASYILQNCELLPKCWILNTVKKKVVKNTASTER